jgi:hypothetical protein
MHPHAGLIERFYQAFQRRDPAPMAAAYAPDAAFRDPVFRLEGWKIGAMWRMLCERGTDLRVEFRDIRADETMGTATWQAWYTFSATGRPVHNHIQASFGFARGLILRHQDRFDLWAWTSQALGLKGRLLGWTPPVQAAIRRQAAGSLERYILQRGLSEAPR